MAAASSDSHDLAALGYRQELARSLGSFSAFAAGFSYLSILTGIFQMFHMGFRAGGPAFIWSWPAVFVGQFLVALCFAELAAHYPLSGGIYQWSKHVGSGAVGWMAGWVYLASLVISISAVALALQVSLPQISACFQLVGTGATSEEVALNGVILGCALIVVTTLINAVGVGLLARINNLGVFSELCGAVLLIVLLAVHARNDATVVFETADHTQGLACLPPMLAAALMASYVMYGFDTAGALAEETTDPRRRAPRAILQALTAAAVLGLLLMLSALLAAPSWDGLGDENRGLPNLVKSVLGSRLGTVFLVDVAFAIAVCTLAVQTSTVRLIFSMARDNNLPCGAALARVSATSRTPTIPAVVAGVLAALILLANLVVPGLLDLVVPIAILWANLAYLLVTGPLLYRRLHGWPQRGGSGAKRLFALGRCGLLCNALAVLWGIVMVVNIAWPRPEVYGERWYQRGGAALFTAALLLVGGVYYFAVQRHRTGILPEHRP